MLPEVNTSNPAFKIFQNSVVGSMQEAELKSKKQKDTRLKKVKQAEDKDQYSGDLKDVPEDEKVLSEDDVNKKQHRSPRKHMKFSSKKYAATAYKMQQEEEHTEETIRQDPIAEI